MLTVESVDSFLQGIDPKIMLGVVAVVGLLAKPLIYYGFKAVTAGLRHGWSLVRPLFVTPEMSSLAKNLLSRIEYCHWEARGNGQCLVSDANEAIRPWVAIQRGNVELSHRFTKAERKQLYRAAEAKLAIILRNEEEAMLANYRS